VGKPEVEVSYATAGLVNSVREQTVVETAFHKRRCATRGVRNHVVILKVWSCVSSLMHLPVTEWRHSRSSKANCTRGEFLESYENDLNRMK